MYLFNHIKGSAQIRVEACVVPNYMYHIKYKARFDCPESKVFDITLI